MGREFVKQLSGLYTDLDEIWVFARRRDRLEELKRDTPVTLRIFAGDLLQKQIYEELENALTETKAEISVLVNAAGFGKVGKVEEIACDDELSMIDLNCISLTHMAKVCISHMTKGSHMINLASAAAFCPQPGFSVYAATKSYVLSFSRSLRAELEDRKISVTAVCPGPVATEFFDVAGKKENSGAKDAVMAKPEAVVKKALRDAKKKKAMSVYGVTMKLCHVATKIVPTGLILKLMKNVW